MDKKRLGGSLFEILKEFSDELNKESSKIKGKELNRGGNKPKKRRTADKNSQKSFYDSNKEGNKYYKKSLKKLNEEFLSEDDYEGEYIPHSYNPKKKDYIEETENFYSQINDTNDDYNVKKSKNNNLINLRRPDSAKKAFIHSIIFQRKGR